MTQPNVAVPWRQLPKPNCGAGFYHFFVDLEKKKKGATACVATSKRNVVFYASFHFLTTRQGNSERNQPNPTHTNGLEGTEILLINDSYLTTLKKLSHSQCRSKGRKKGICKLLCEQRFGSLQFCLVPWQTANPMRFDFECQVIKEGYSTDLKSNLILHPEATKVKVVLWEVQTFTFRCLGLHSKFGDFLYERCDFKTARENKITVSCFHKQSPF